MLILSLVFASLLSLPFITGRLWIFAWVGFIPLFILLKDKNPRQAFFAAFLSGIFFWSFTIFWLIHVTLFGLILLILYLALYFGAFGWSISFFKMYERGGFRFLCIPCLWVILEYIRAHLLSGFGWASLGYSQYLNLPVIQISDIAGVYGVSFLVMTVNCAIFAAIYMRSNKRLVRRFILVTMFCLFVALAYGLFRMHQNFFRMRQKAQGRFLKVSVIQGNIAQEMKWDTSAQQFILGEYLNLTKNAAGDNPDLIIWPESSSPGFLGQDGWVFEEIYSLLRQINIPLLIGSDRKSVV